MENVSVVIPCYNQIRYTRLCIQSVLDHTTYPFELILVDNGSTDETQEYLRNLQTTDGVYRNVSLQGFHVLINKENRGVAAALNQGIALSRGEYVCYLNNDTVVTDGWLEGLVACAKSDERIGLVGCSTNLVSSSSRRLYPPVAGFRNLREIQRTAAALSLARKGQYREAHFVHGFCMLIKREVMRTIGLFDENFYPCVGDDLDYSFRTKEAGYRLVNARDVFVFHFHGRASLSREFKAGFTAIDVVARAALERFADKWGNKGIEFLRVLQKNKKEYYDRVLDEVVTHYRSGVRVTV